MLAYFLQLTLNGLITGAILALTGVGASLVFGIQRVANFAHGEYLTFAAYVALVLNVALHQSIVVATAGAMTATALLAVGLHFTVLRPLRGRGLVALSLITTGLALMLRNVIFIGAGPTIRAYGIDQSAVYNLGLVRISPGQAVALVIAAIVAPAVAFFLAPTRLRQARAGGDLGYGRGPQRGVRLAPGRGARRPRRCDVRRGAGDIRSEPRLPGPLPHLHDGGAGRDRERLRRAGRGHGAGAGDGSLD